MSPMAQRHAFYGAALAQAHAEAYADNFHTGFDWLGEMVKTAPGPARLFDIGCGDGSWMRAARDMKIEVKGIDISQAFTSMAKQTGLDVSQESAAQAQLPAGTNAVTALGEVLAYAPAALTPCALNVARALPSGGVFIFDMPGPDVPEGEVEAQGDGWHLHAKTRIKGSRLTRQISVEGAGGVEKEVHHQHLFAAKDVRDILSGFGFQAEIFDSYGACALLPGRFAILARKS